MEDGRRRDRGWDEGPEGGGMEEERRLEGGGTLVGRSRKGRGEEEGNEKLNLPVTVNEMNTIQSKMEQMSLYGGISVRIVQSNVEKVVIRVEQIFG